MIEQPRSGGNKDAAVHPGTTIFYGGSIVTVDDQVPEVEALAVTGGRIVALGDRKKVFQLHSQRTRMVDLQGRALLPGFIDSHVHVGWTAFVTHHCVDASRLEPGNRDQMIGFIRNAVAGKKPHDWLVAYGYDSELESGTPRLTADEMDEAHVPNPILIIDRSRDSLRANHKALRLAGITRRATAPRGCSYVRDARGELTGEVRGPQSLAPFRELIPWIDFNRKLKDSRAVLQAWARKGCTSVYDAAVGALWGQEEVRLLLELASDLTTPVRLRAALVPTDNLPRSAGITSRQGNDRLCFVGIQFTIEEEESDARQTSIENEPRAAGLDAPEGTDDELKVRLQAWHDSNWQLLVGANGTRAVDQALRVIETVLRDSPNRKHRHRLDRCTRITSEQLERAARLGLTLSHPGASRNSRLKTKQSGSQWNWSAPLGSEFLYNLAVSLQSDTPTTPVNPVRDLQTAASWILSDENSTVSDPREAVDQALKTLTIFPAYQCFLDHKVGSLAVGKLADLVVLDRNPRETDIDTLGDIRVVQTYVQGNPQQGEEAMR
jgi:predicted amidohydrolase YtcJ